MESTPFGDNYTTLMGRCVTSKTEPYTTIDIWHIATPNIIYHGIMSGGAVVQWYQYSLQAV